ncbi:MAG: MBL fold metallo-hydrolase [Alphaproteobacteria bacterium]|nr:MBL fold metallo-hydrolase [Alphaproteobacteria bacterium]
MSGDDFYVRFWGVRGSIPCPGPDTLRYGGNTSCLEVRCGEHLFILDAGTGLRPLAASLGDDALVADVLFTHSHLDHVNGWAYFTPLKDPRHRFRIWAGHLQRPHRLDGVLARFLDDPLAPVHLGNLRADLTYHEFTAADSFAPRPGVFIRTAPLNHPNGATGYRIERGGRAICYVTDTEHVLGRTDPNVLSLIHGADIVIYDSTYTDEEYPNFVGWGHSTWQEGVRLCDRAGVKLFVAFHHDPNHGDGTMDRIAAELTQARPGSLVAREGLTLRP